MTGWNEELRRYFAAKAPTYDDVGVETYWRFSDDLLWRHIVHQVNRSVSARLRILDAGGGTARWTVRLLQHFPGASSQIIDVSSDMLAVARRRIDDLSLENRCEIVEGDLDTLDSSDERFDVVICFHNVLGFVGNPASVVRTLADRLAADGVMLLVVPNALHAVYYSILRGQPEEVGRIRDHGEVAFSRGPPMRVFTGPEIESWLVAAGLRGVVRGFPVTVYPAPSATFARANETIASMLSAADVRSALLDYEWSLTSDPRLAPRGNNLLVCAAKEASRLLSP